MLHVWKRYAEDTSHDEVMSSSSHGSISTTGEQVVGGRYRLLQHVGEGELATVHRALDLHSTPQVEVAIKILRSERSREPKAKARFYRGAVTMRKLDRNPHVVRVIDISNKDGSEPYFYVMEFIAQGHLLQYARSKHLQPNDVLHLGLEVGDALAAAHHLRHYHRDVKPANVLIDKDGHARLTDFDLVRDEYNSGGTTTESLGTLGYRAPEHSRSADHRSDQYSLAMTLIATIARKDATPHNTKALVQLVSEKISPDVFAVLEKALREDPTHRHDSIEEFCDALANALDTSVSRTAAFDNSPGVGAEKEAVAESFASTRVSEPIATNLAPETTRLVAPTSNTSTRSRRAMMAWTATAAMVAIFAVLAAGAWSRPENATRPPPPPTAAPSRVASPATPTNRSVSGSELDEVLRVDHSKTAFAIRISADNTLEEAMEDARVVLRTSRFQPWIVRQRFGKGLYFVYVGGYSDRAVADADFETARAVRGEGGYVHFMPKECPTLEWTPAGYHDCER